MLAAAADIYLMHRTEVALMLKVENDYVPKPSGGMVSPRRNRNELL
jgi:hypothetical protein